METETAETIILPSLPCKIQKTEREGQIRIITPKEDLQQNFALGAIYTIYSRTKRAQQPPRPPTENNPQQIRRERLNSLLNERALRGLSYEAFGSPSDLPELEINTYTLFVALDQYNTSAASYWETSNSQKDSCNWICIYKRISRRFA